MLIRILYTENKRKENKYFIPNFTTFQDYVDQFSEKNKHVESHYHVTS